MMKIYDFCLFFREHLIRKYKEEARKKYEQELVLIEQKLGNIGLPQNDKVRKNFAMILEMQKMVKVSI